MGGVRLALAHNSPPHRYGGDGSKLRKGCRILLVKQPTDREVRRLRDCDRHAARDWRGVATLEPSDSCRRDADLSQLTSKGPRDFDASGNVPARVDRQPDFAKLVSLLRVRCYPDFGALPSIQT